MDYEVKGDCIQNGLRKIKNHNVQRYLHKKKTMSLPKRVRSVVKVIYFFKLLDTS